MKSSFFKNRNRKTTVFLICLSISAFFWLLIKLSQEYEISVNIPVTYKNLPENQILVNKPDSIITIRINDNGFDLIGISLLGAPESLDIDIANMRSKQISPQKKLSYTLVRSKLEELNQIFGSSKNLRLLGPDSLVLKFEKLATKEVVIVPDIQYRLQAQHQIKGKALLSPSTMTIFGSENSLKSIDTLYTEKRIYPELNQSFVDDLKLVIPKNINTNIKQCELNIEIEKFTEAKMTIPIPRDFTNTSDIRIFPNHVTIKYAVSFERFNDINAEEFKIKAQTDPHIVGKLNISLEKYPADIRIIDYSPKVAEFIIIK